MGEAKRRKQLLGDNYGKPQPEIDPEIAKVARAFLSNVTLALKHFSSSKLGNCQLDLNALKELISTNFCDEFEALVRLRDDQEGTFDWARLQIFKAALLLLADTPQLSSDDANYITEEIRKAGKAMYSVDGMRGLEDQLVWSFLPRCWHRAIDEAFNGIGTWVS